MTYFSKNEENVDSGYIDLPVLFYQVNLVHLLMNYLFNRNQKAMSQVYLLLVSTHCDRFMLSGFYMLTSLSLMIKRQREIARAYAYLRLFNCIFLGFLRKFW